MTMLCHADARKFGQIQELYNRQPRSALVRISTRDRQYTSLKRPLKLLYPLEVCEPEPQQDSSHQKAAGIAEQEATGALLQ